MEVFSKDLKLDLIKGHVIFTDFFSLLSSSEKSKAINAFTNNLNLSPKNKKLFKTYFIRYTTDPKFSNRLYYNINSNREISGLKAFVYPMINTLPKSTLDTAIKQMWLSIPDKKRKFYNKIQFKNSKTRATALKALNKLPENMKRLVLKNLI